jgi:hypothetical protein
MLKVQFHAAARPSLLAACNPFPLSSTAAAGLSPVRQQQQQQQQQQRGRGVMTSAGRKLELEVVDIENPKEYNFILGHGEHSIVAL